MRRHVLSSLIALVAVVSLVVDAVRASAGGREACSGRQGLDDAADSGWKPDLQGVYSNAQTIPVARPANLGAKEFYTDEADKAASAAVRGEAGVAAAARPAGRILMAASPFTMTPASSV